MPREPEELETYKVAKCPMPLPADYFGSIEHVVIQDDKPVDSSFAEKEQRLLTEPLYSSWRGGKRRRPFVAMANVGLFHRPKEPPLVPDAMIAVDVATTGDPRRKENETYFIWTRGKAPDVVIEIVSDRRGGEETRKLEKYANWGVILYVIHDPAEKLRNGVLRAFGLIRGNYVPIDPKWFEAVELGLTLWKGTYEDRTDTWLRWCDSRGRVIPTGNERADREKSKAKKDRQRAEQERQRAEQERQRAEQERQRAEQERQRAERLKAQLRARGIEPDNGTNGR